MNQRLSTDRTKAIRRLFEELVECGPEERAERLQAVGDTALRREVASLLAAADQPDDKISALDELHALLAPREDAAYEVEDGLRAETDPLNLEGTRLGRYTVETHLGGGGMGVVYRARDTKLDRHVALKFLPPHLSASEEAKARFIHEAKAASALDHPNIGTIHEINETAEGQLFIVMAYYAGETLKAKIARRMLPVDTAVDYAMQIAAALARAHDAGIVHRDVKPANVMVTDDGYAKLLDFGLAKLGDVSLTRTGRVLGTIAYMSPEQARGEAVDHRTDLWALGVLLYEMLTGRRPFNGEHPQAIIYSILNEVPEPIRQVHPAASPALAQIVARALQKKPEARFGSASEMEEALKNYRDRRQAAERPALNLERLLFHLRKPRIAIPAVGVILLMILGAIWFADRQAQIRWAREEALPEIERLVEASWRDYTEAYALAEQAERYIPNDPALAALMAQSSLHIDIDTEPPGADVYMKEYDAPEREWQHVGVTPIDSLRVPVGIFRWKMEKEGHETVLAAASTWDISTAGKALLIPNDLTRVLDENGTVPEGMVRVQGAKTPHGTLADFFIDRYEVTNDAYKVFIDSGGYRNRDYWQHEFVREGTVLSWDEAMAAFVDQTGRPGPATWQAGDYPEGQADYPVTGVSWYEAAAYAEFAGKRLPTVPHWGLARGEHTSLIQWPQLGGFEVFAPFSNFKGEGPVAAGRLPGITPYGAYDMAGNVREWCWNATAAGRMIRGGAWNDNPYRFTELSSVPAFDRSAQNGFRCARYLDPEPVPASALAELPLAESRNYYEEEPVSDAIFQVYKEQFAYDKTSLNARVESRDESADNWIHERITVDTAYDHERLILHLFLPANAPPPYQTVVYFPGTSPLFQSSSEDMTSYYEFPVFLSFLVKNGRAVLFPVYKGTFERRDDALFPVLLADTTHRYTEYVVQLIKDLRRSIDYLETRPDVDATKLAYYGMSWGGEFGAIIPAVEERFKASILLPGGLQSYGRPEVLPINYVSRVETPTLILSGKYDTVFPYETSIKPMFDLLGTPDAHKELKAYETDHIPPRNEYIKETLAWLDRYLGPVE